MNSFRIVQKGNDWIPQIAVRFFGITIYWQSMIIRLYDWDTSPITINKAIEVIRNNGGNL